MKIKKYTVTEMQDAIQLIKKELGPEAIIVSSHKVKGPGWTGWFKRMLEVTAVLDDIPEPRVKALPREVEQEAKKYSQAIPEQKK
ncbi:hypothetical protein N752_22040 [Desulforamulus aquiferis]|nr:hypothetical protein [Desulforamulus aquiferis]RYD03095.1 hypothetical protein N752_22040 [Desulforamulus aquiferis]